MLNNYVFNCRLNGSSAGISQIFSARLFQAIVSPTRKARSSNPVQDDRRGKSLSPDVDAD